MKQSQKELELPKLPGVYLFKDDAGQVIYIGKAKNLHKRVQSYFLKKTDWKVCDLINEHDSIEHIVTSNEMEALLLEAHLIRSFKPKYNVLLKSGNPFLYLFIRSYNKDKVLDGYAQSCDKKNIPKLELVRSKSLKGTYFGPFLYKQKARSIYDNLLRTFKLKLCSRKLDNGCLNYHLGVCAGNCLSSFDIHYYLQRLDLVKKLLKKDFNAFKSDLSEQIIYNNSQLNFEKSKHLTEYLSSFYSVTSMLQSGLQQTKYFKDAVHITSNINNKLDFMKASMTQLKSMLGLSKNPVSIDCFDVSHFQSRYIVGSCIRFSYGLPDKNSFRRFKIKALKEQDDYKALQEIVSRRYKDNDFPDIILIDGGLGQLNAIKKIKELVDIPDSTLLLSLAKKEEILMVLKNNSVVEEVHLDIHSKVGQLLIALRDYAHHFAASYHKLLRSKYNFSQI